MRDHFKYPRHMYVAKKQNMDIEKQKQHLQSSNKTALTSSRTMKFALKALPLLACSSSSSMSDVPVLLSANMITLAVISSPLVLT